jgi:hypothetical protein
MLLRLMAGRDEASAQTNTTVQAASSPNYAGRGSYYSERIS